jgi:phosphatidylglycerophosphate synthase
VITRAYLVADPEVRPERMIGGMPALLRQMLSLQAAGIVEVVLVGAAAQAYLPDTRVRLDVHHAANLPAHQDRQAIVAVAGTVWTPAFVQQLVHAPAASGSLMVSVRPDQSVIVPRTAADVDAATMLLMRSLYKPTDGIVSRHLNRRLSLPISRHLLRSDITPNHLTAIATLFGVAGVCVAYRGGYWNLLTGAFLLQMQSLLDGCDGEVARIKYLHSRVGEWFDQVADDVLNIAFLGAVGIALARGGHAWASRVAGASIACQVVYMIALYAGLAFKADGRGSVAALRWWVDKPGAASPAARVVGDLARRDFVCFFYLACAMVNAIAIAFVWQAAVTAVSAVVTTIGWIAFGGPEKRGRESFTGSPAAVRTRTASAPPPSTT